MILTHCKECGQELGPKPKFASNHEFCSDICKKAVRKRNFGGRISTAAQWKSNGIIKTDGSIFTIEDYEELLNLQNGHCALCYETDDLCLDHNHNTGIARGILCHRHNTGIGKLGDDIPHIQKVLQYLQNFQQIKSNKVAGIDYSMSCPAICTFDGDPSDFSYDKCKFYYFSEYKALDYPNIFRTEPKKYFSDMERFNNIAQWAMRIVLDCAEIAIEGYSMGSKGMTYQIGENTAILKLLLWENGKSFKSIPPTVNKKLASGRGNATKDQMYEQWLKDTQFDLKATIQPNRKLGNPTTDLVDAFYLCRTLMLR